MASVNVAKYTTSAARGLSVHFDDVKRVEMQHENPHINKVDTAKNYWIGCDSYNEILYKLKERQKELDALIPPKRIRADRVTCLAVEVPIPAAISENNLDDDFMNNAYRVLEDVFGSSNVHGMTVHKDEVHDYIEPISKELKTSLIHGHGFISPEDKEKGLNAKACLNKERLKMLNNAMNEMCLKRYGIEYNTHELARNLSVEQLKNESLITEREMLSQQIKSQQQQLHIANVIEKAAKSVKMPQMREQKLGDGIIVQTDIETLKKAFIALSHEQNILKREQAAKALQLKARQIVAEAEAKANSLDEKLESSKLRLELDKIKTEHPELFDNDMYISLQQQKYENKIRFR